MVCAFTHLTPSHPLPLIYPSPFLFPPQLCHQGVSKVEIDMDAQRVYVTASLSGQELLDVLKKTGRECSYIGVKS